MLLCPECQHSQNNILSSQCLLCKTEIERLGEILVCLSSADKKSLAFQNYKAMYDQIAIEDLTESFQHLEYLQVQTEKLFSYLPHKKGMSICEIGIGQGGLLKKLSTLSPSKLVGIDIASAYLKKMIDEKVAFQPFIMNGENLCFEEEFDLVVSCDVIEHVLSLGNYLHSIYRSLKKGGIFVVRTPYLEDYTRYSHFRGHKYDRMHLRNFSKQTLKIVLKGVGFQIKKYHYDGFMDQCFRFCDWKFSPAHLIRRYIREYYGSYIKLAAIPNWIGKLLIKPSTITAVCVKESIP